MSFIGVITGEFLIAKEGIGFLITEGGQIFNPDLVASGITLLFIVTIVFHFLFKILTNLIIKKCRISI